MFNYISIFFYSAMNKILQIHPNHISLSNFRLNKFGYLVTKILMYIFLVIPFILFISILGNGYKPSMGFFAFTVISGFAVYFFYRLLTWNKHGEENFIFSKNKLVYHPKAKNISFQIREVEIHQLSVSIITTEDQVTFEGNLEGLARLKFR